MKTTKIIALLIIGLFIMSSCFFSKPENKVGVNAKIEILNSRIEDSEKVKELLTERFANFGVEEVVITPEGDNIFTIKIKKINEDYANQFSDILMNVDLSIYESYEGREIIPYFEDVNNALVDLLDIKLEKQYRMKNTQDSDDLVFLESDEDSLTEYEEVFDPDAYPLYKVLQPYIGSNETGHNFFVEGPIVGIAFIKDTQLVNEYFAKDRIKRLFPDDLTFLWTQQIMQTDSGGAVQLIAVKYYKPFSKIIDGSYIKEAKVNIDPEGRREIYINMNEEGAKIWAEMTEKNIGRSLVFVINGRVYYFPTVQSTIIGGVSKISGVEKEKAQIITDLLNLKNSKLPFDVTVLEVEEIK